MDMNRLRLVVGILLAISLPDFAGADAPSTRVRQEDALAIMFQVVTQFTDAVKKGDLEPIHNEDAFISAAVNELLEEADGVSPKKTDELKADLTSLGRQSGELHAAADAGRQAQAEVELG